MKDMAEFVLVDENGKEINYSRQFFNRKSVKYSVAFKSDDTCVVNAVRVYDDRKQLLWHCDIIKVLNKGDTLTLNVDFGVINERTRHISRSNGDRAG